MLEQSNLHSPPSPASVIVVAAGRTVIRVGVSLFIIIPPAADCLDCRRASCRCQHGKHANGEERMSTLKDRKVNVQRTQHKQKANRQKRFPEGAAKAACPWDGEIHTPVSATQLCALTCNAERKTEVTKRVSTEAQNELVLWRDY